MSRDPIRPSRLDYSIYSSPSGLLEERRRIFNSHWLLAVHASEIPHPGDYVSLNFAGEPIVVIRGDDGEIRAFFNICVHRGFPLFEGSSGNIHGRVHCAYHGWAYDSFGNLVAPARGDQSCLGLKPVQCESFCGFVFICIRPTTQPVKSVFGSLAPELEELKLHELPPPTEKTFQATVPVNWKVFIENTLEGSHVPSVHPGLDELIGHKYRLDFEELVSKTVSPLKPEPPATWSEKMYHSIFGGPKTAEWKFYFVFPNLQISVYPEQVFYLQAIPIDTGKTLVRGRFLNRGAHFRSHRLGGYLNRRIGRKIYREDMKILKRVQGGLESLEFPGPLHLAGEEEKVIDHFHSIMLQKLNAAQPT
jgi:phenylpropionate dioxygenase-like ring-hydroxylating dioxygenase large terminal subunit